MSALLVHVSSAAVPTVVTVAGEIDMASVGVLRHRLPALPDADTVLEMSGVRLLSGVGVTELVHLRDRLARADAHLALAAAPRMVRRILDITGIAGTVVLADTVDQAVALLATGDPR